MALPTTKATSDDTSADLTVRALEDLVISAMYAGLIDGSLDPRRRCVRVHSVAPLRDLAPGAVPSMAGALRAWSERCAFALEDLESRILQVRWDARCRQKRSREAKEWTDRILEEAARSKKGGGDAGRYEQHSKDGMFASGPAAAAAALLDGHGRGRGQGPGHGHHGHGHGHGHSHGHGHGHGHGHRNKMLGRGKRLQNDDEDDEAMDVDDDEGEKKRNKRG